MKRVPRGGFLKMETERKAVKELARGKGIDFFASHSCGTSNPRSCGCPGKVLPRVSIAYIGCEDDL